MDDQIIAASPQPTLSRSVEKKVGRRVRVRWLAFGFILLAAISVFATPYLLKAAGRSLVHQGSIEVADAILIENFDPNYLLFERTRQLLQEGWAKTVLVPTQASSAGETPNAVSEGFVQVMVRVSRIAAPEIVPVREIEPITLNTALQVRGYLQKENIHSIIVVVAAFRSRRSYLVWNAVLNQASIRVFCVPVFGPRTTDNWYHTWHGWQEVALEATKLAYYRLSVLPRLNKYEKTQVPWNALGRSQDAR